MPTPPELPAGLESVTAEQLTRHSRWEDIEVDGADLALLEAVEGRLRSSRLSGGDIGDARLVHLVLEDTELLGVNAAAVRAEGATIRRSRLRLLRLTGANLSAAELYDVALAECRADYVSFNRARLQDVHLDGCNLREADFTGARLERVRFDRCDLTGADFAQATFTRCEMHGCTLEGAKGVASLSGVRMPWHDIVSSAGVFAAAIGVHGIDEDGDR